MVNGDDVRYMSMETVAMPIKCAAGFAGLAALESEMLRTRRRVVRGTRGAVCIFEYSPRRPGFNTVFSARRRVAMTVSPSQDGPGVPDSSAP